MNLKFDVHEIFCHAVYVYNQHGYVTKDDALIHQTTPTIDRIKQSLYENYFNDNTSEYETASYMVEWLKNVSSGNNEFMQKCRSFIDTGIDSFSDISMLASLIRSYIVYSNNYLKIEKLKIINFLDEFFGLEKINYTIKLKYLFYTQCNQPLNGFDYHFKSEDGHKMLLHKPKKISLIDNSLYRFKGKVKKHLIDNDIKTTVLRGKQNDLSPWAINRTGSR